MFCVNVPVLSLQTTVTAPSVSTLGNFLTIVLTLTILWTPRAKTIVTTAGRPSGTAATANEIDVTNMLMIVVSKSLPWIDAWTTAMIKNTTTKPIVKKPNNFDKEASFFWSGVVSSPLSCNIEAILPISVFIPVETTIPSPCP